MPHALELAPDTTLVQSTVMQQAVGPGIGRPMLVAPGLPRDKNC